MRTAAALLISMMIAPTSDLAAKAGGKVDAKIDSSTGSSKHQTSSRGSDPSRVRFRLAAESKDDEAKPEEADEPDDPPPPPMVPNDDDLIFERPRDLNLLTRDEMMSLAGKYQADIENDVAHVETARTIAFKDRDVVKMTCIDDKLVQMRLISQTTTPRLKRMAKVRADEFLVRGEFINIAPNWKRTKELRAEVETCIGETLNNVTVVAVSHEDPDIPGPDPTDAPGPTLNTDRPPEASPWR